MSTKSLCHFCMGEWMPVWRPNSKTVLIFAHRLIFSFLLPCRHQRLQQWVKLPDYCSLHLRKTSSYEILSDWNSFVVVCTCSCSLAAEDLACVVQLTGPSSSSLPWFSYPEAQTTLYWEMLEQWCVTSYSIQRLTLMLNRALSVFPIKAISLAKTDWWGDTSVFPAGRETCVDAGILLQCSFFT